MIYEIIQKIPDVVWAAIAASLLTLGGVWLTNRGSYKRLKKQLEHESHQKDRDRNMEIRRQVYLDAAEALTENHLLLMKLSDLGISDTEISNRFAKSAATISKVYAIGSAKTVKTVTELTSAIGSKHLFLAAERLPLIRRKSDMDIQNELITKSSSERDQMLEVMKNINIQGIRDNRMMSVVERNFKYHQEKISEYIAKRNELQEINGKAHIELVVKCFQAYKEVNDYYPPAISAVREEMDLPFEEASYRQTIERSYEVAEKSLTEFIEKVTKQ
jgi:hypothetical protein